MYMLSILHQRSFHKIQISRILKIQDNFFKFLSSKLTMSIFRLRVNHNLKIFSQFSPVKDLLKIRSTNPNIITSNPLAEYIDTEPKY